MRRGLIIVAIVIQQCHLHVQYLSMHSWKYINYRPICYADTPPLPTSFWHTVSTSEHFLTLQWSLICDNDVDCSIIKIVINGTNPLNVSYPTNLAILDISEYPSEDPIEIAIYAINKCSMMSKPSTRIVNIGKWEYHNYKFIGVQLLWF